MSNPTPFPLASEAPWRQLPNGEWFRPARLYLRKGVKPVAVLKSRQGSVLFCEFMSSGYGGAVIDARKKIVGFIFGRTAASPARVRTLLGEEAGE